MSRGGPRPEGVKAPSEVLADDHASRRALRIRQERALEYSGAALFAVLFGYILVILREDLLPERFSYDGNAIQQAAQGHLGFLDQSFTVVGGIYRSLGLAHNGTLAGVVTYSVAAAAILIAVARRGTDAPITTGSAMILAVTVLFSAVYLGYYSKDIFVAILAIIALTAPQRLIGESMLLGAMLLYAGYFRTYWYLVVIFYVAMRIAAGRDLRLKRMLVVGALGLVATSFVLFFVNGVPADFYRYTVNSDRIGAADATTAITRFIDLPEPFGGVINNLITLGGLLVPIPLALNGGAYYLVLAALLLSLWLWTARAAQSWAGQSPSVHLQRAICLVGALVAVQAIFEPDYGSAVRHLTPLLPLVLLIAWSARARSPENGSSGAAVSGA